MLLCLGLFWLTVSLCIMTKKAYLCHVRTDKVELSICHPMTKHTCKWPHANRADYSSIVWMLNAMSNGKVKNFFGACTGWCSAFYTFLYQGWTKAACSNFSQPLSKLPSSTLFTTAGGRKTQKLFFWPFKQKTQVFCFNTLFCSLITLLFFLSLLLKPTPQPIRKQRF